jgi:ubiquinone/menaquinone biosynthesis C-methylase UbiE
MRAIHAPIYAHRQEVLVRLIMAHSRAGCRVLDVGCGFGHLGKAIMDHSPKVTVEGLERAKRGGELILVHLYDGSRIPWPDNTFDIVILADVLHHELDPDHLLRESVRVSRELTIVKDHLREGFLAQQRISLLDWAANAPYNVRCTYRYNNLRRWREMFESAHVRLKEELTTIDIYPPLINQLLGKGLHYFAVLEKN